MMSLVINLTRAHSSSSLYSSYRSRVFDPDVLCEAFWITYSTRAQRFFRSSFDPCSLLISLPDLFMASDHLISCGCSCVSAKHFICCLMASSCPFLYFGFATALSSFSAGISMSASALCSSTQRRNACAGAVYFNTRPLLFFVSRVYDVRS